MSRSVPLTTPLIRLDGSRHIWLKDETQQISGAFKFRGAFSKLKTLLGTRGIVTASTGNHGVAVANVAFRLKQNAHVFLPKNAPTFKAQMIQKLGCRVTFVGNDLDDCAIAAQKWAEEQGAKWFSGFDDDVVIQGYRPLFTEIKESDIGPMQIYVPVGGGGLLAAALLEVEQPVEVIGVQSAACESMERSLLAGLPVRVEIGTTIATGLAVPKVGTIPYQICSKRGPRLVSVSDQEIRFAMKVLWESNGIRAEPAGAAALAGALRFKDDGLIRSVCVISGGNLDPEEHAALIG